MRRRAALFAMIVGLGTAGTATAQSWAGPYAGVTFGGAFPSAQQSETILFDTDLNGEFNDTVRTAAGAAAFSPGFCGGLALTSTPADGCTEDEGGLDLSLRAGYDRQRGRIVFGGVLELSATDATDSVTAFSTTPAFYGMTRELNSVLALRGRVGYTVRERMLVYGTAGFARGSIEHRFSTSNVVNTFVKVDSDGNVDDDGDNSGGSWGYQLGAGAEWRLGGRWGVIGEYMFTSLDDRDDALIRAQGPAAATNPFLLVNPSGTDFQRSDSFSVHALRVGMSVRF